MDSGKQLAYPVNGFERCCIDRLCWGCPVCTDKFSSSVNAQFCKQMPNRISFFFFASCNLAVDPYAASRASLNTVRFLINFSFSILELS